MLSILLVEDNPADAFIMQLALEASGVEHSLKVLTDGAEAVDYCKRFCNMPEVPAPDVFLLDLELPKVRGMEVLEAVRQQHRFNEVIVYVTSSAMRPKELERVLSMGAEFFLKTNRFETFVEFAAELAKRTQVAPGRRLTADVI